MKSKEALNKICLECQLYKGKMQVACPFRSISNDYCEEYEQIRKDLEILELLHQRIKPDIFSRICYVPILEERDGVVQDFEAEKIWRWIKNEQ